MTVAVSVFLVWLAGFLEGPPECSPRASWGEGNPEGRYFPADLMRVAQGRQPRWGGSFSPFLSFVLTNRVPLDSVPFALPGPGFQYPHL